MLALQDSPARRFLQGLGESLARPKAIVLVSAHWETRGGPAVSLATHPETIHDFGGFPQALFDVRYPAPGAPETAERVAGLFEAAGIPVGRTAERGLDHGAWVPLSLIYPDADIPVMQVSIVHGASPAVHQQLGAALQQLRTEGVLVLASGSLTHNLYAIRGHVPGAPAPAWVADFEAWMRDKLVANDEQALLAYRTLAPMAEKNHPRSCCIPVLNTVCWPWMPTHSIDTGDARWLTHFMKHWSNRSAG
jgi:4,5-DOPA dioxygenase extradiol